MLGRSPRSGLLGSSLMEVCRRHLAFPTKHRGSFRRQVGAGRDSDGAKTGVADSVGDGQRAAKWGALMLVEKVLTQQFAVASTCEPHRP